MKAVISNRIYLEVTPSLKETLCKELTYKIPSYSDDVPPIIIYNYKVLRPNLMSIPVGREDLVPKHYEIVDKRVTPQVEFPDFKATLRDSQQEIRDDINGSCLINAKVGWGKTFTAISIAHKLGLKTLIIVNTLPLMAQWVAEVEKTLGFTPDTIGNGKFNMSTPIVIGNIATLERRSTEISKAFGTLIVDEVHHAPSRTFTKIVDGSYAKYKIGLSGTLRRKDGLHVVIPNYFSPKIYTPPVENTLVPTIHVYKTGLGFPAGSCWASRVNALKESEAYRLWIYKTVDKYVNMGHKVLLVSDRIDFLKVMSERLESLLVIGETKNREEQLKKIYNNEANVIAGSLSIWKEGISCNPLSCLVMATPINNIPMLEQVIGRIQRLCDNKQNPIVVDPLFDGYTTTKQFNNRLGFYIEQGFPVEYL